MVRPWAIAGPVLILILAAPLLRPLRMPAGASDREAVNFAAVRSVLKDHTLAIDPAKIPSNSYAFDAHDKRFTLDAPAFPVFLSGIGWTIGKMGVDPDSNPVFFEYLLIFFSITFPTAMACGFLYRMGRVFEIRRLWRMIIALSCILATGWFSYCVVLLPYALSAALIVIGTASVIHVSLAKKPMLAIGWLFAGAFCIASASVIEPTAAWALLLMPILVLAMSHPWRVRSMGLLLVVAGAAAPIVMHININVPITGNILPPRFHEEYFADTSTTILSPMASDDIEPLDPTSWVVIGRAINRLIMLTFGTHGIFSHFPALLVAIAGAGIILHRHWTRTMKWIAGGSILAIISLILLPTFTHLHASDMSFAAPGLIVALPILTFCSGAWLRRSHHSVVWTFTGIALGLSIAITIFGATNPAPNGGYTSYTAAEVVAKLFSHNPLDKNKVAQSR